MQAAHMFQVTSLTACRDPQENKMREMDKNRKKG